MFSISIFLLAFLVNISSCYAVPVSPESSPAHPSNVAGILEPSSGLTLEQNIANLLHHLSSQSQPQFQQANLLQVALVINGSDTPRQRSANFNDFRQISLVFEAGPLHPLPPLPDRYFRISNWNRDQTPQPWDHFNPPRFFGQYPPLVWLENRRAMDWGLVRDRMTVRRADELIKMAGFSGAYEVVWLFEGLRRPLQYCFEMPW